jgi:hypothetical protein
VKRFLTLLWAIIPAIATAQTTPIGEINGSVNYVQPAVPFLTISPDSRASALGDAGVATSPDAYSIHWNPSKMAFIKDEMGLAISYSPWLAALKADVNLYQLCFYKKYNERNTVTGSITYFSLGTIQFTDNNGQLVANKRPNEFAIDVALARKFADKISGGIAFRYIRSDLTQEYSNDGSETNAANAFAADISMYYHNDFTLNKKNSNYALGLDISNIGNKVSYASTSEKEFIPINLRIGGMVETELDEYNSLMVTLDLNKLLVPTPDTLADGTYSPRNDISVPAGMIQSFYDAPGGFKEEMHEITYSAGTEYWYRKQFALRAGYFYEYKDKGNRNYCTVGVGLRMNVFGADISYLIPMYLNNPLGNTIRFSILLNFEALRKDEKNKN